MRTRTTLAIAVTVAGAAGLAIAQQARRPTLHEDMPAPTTATQQPGRTIGGSGGGMPAAVFSGDKLIPKPALTDPDQAAKSEPVLGAGGFAADRQTQMKPDDKTGPDATLHYVSVFNPDVLPFKRMSSFDAVDELENLKVGRTARIEVPVGGVTDHNTRDYFRGSVLVELTAGKDVALPSVAPDMRILSYETRPKIAVKFEKDGADNFYVRTDETTANGKPYRLIFDVDADAGYFAPSIPTSRKYTPRQLAMITPQEIRPILPDLVRASAAKTLVNLDLDPDMDLGVAFGKLVSYFRAFEAKQLPPSASTDIYRELCDSQAGVCRHRSFAFMITANALGIPTRYVQNEAHAFVEVWFPERNWQRIDLGGAALRMEVTGADDKTLHRPRADDPFPKPSQYTQNYTQLQGDIAGLTKQQIDDKQKPLDQSPSSGSLGGGPGLGSGAGSNMARDTILPDVNLPPVAMDPKKKNPKLEVTTSSASAYRGGVLHVEAIVRVDGKPLPGHPVDVYLSPAGMRGANSKPLGRATSTSDGTFRQDFTIPSSINLATYEIWLSSSPDVYYNAALSD
jgi:transglutaminase-like putative cysteine protease